MPTAPQPKLKATALYLGDNGRCFCGAHAGMTAQYSGRDLSGQPVMEITPSVLAEARAEGFEPACERKGCKAKASALYV